LDRLLAFQPPAVEQQVGHEVRDNDDDRDQQQWQQAGRGEQVEETEADSDGRKDQLCGDHA
jgi:hypothetical protein